MHVLLVKGQVGHFLYRQQAGPVTGLVVLFRNQGRAVRPHQASDVRPDHVDARNLFEGPQDGIVVEGSTLAHNVVTQFVGTPHLNDLKEGVLDNGEGQAGGNVANRGPLLLHLLDLRVHKDRATGAKVSRVPCQESRLGEFADVVLQARREGFQEGPTAG